jgi:DNA polymerase-3 subunit delta
MKLSFRQIEPFVKSPDKAARVILIYGPDDGLMRERTKIIGQSVVADINDPFNTARLSAEILAEDPARLFDEANAISMMGGDRLIRVEGASDKLTTLIKSYLENPSDMALILLEAGELGPRSSLRKLCESAKNAAALPCYVEDERDTARLIRETLHAEGFQAAPDAVSWLASAISGDRLKIRGELDKLITYKGKDKSPLTLEEAQNCCGVAGAIALDDLIFALADRNTAKALAVYGRLIEEDTPFIVILRAIQNHFRRLHATASRIQSGETADSAMKKLSPPVFFKYVPVFTAQLRQWSPKQIEMILARLMTLEAECKKTGAPVETLCAQTIFGITRTRSSR